MAPNGETGVHGHGVRAIVGRSGFSRDRRTAAWLLNLVVAAGLSAPAVASDACSTRAIHTTADVAVDDGSRFETESWFHTRDGAAIRHVSDTEQIVAVEGPLAWLRRGDETALGGGFHASFAIGHQHHALLLHFDEIVDDARPNADIAFEGRARSGRSGSLPNGGGTAHLVGNEGRRPAGLVLEVPDAPPIVHTFGDWRRTTDGDELPYQVTIDDGSRVFEYRYKTVETTPRSPLWFMDAAGSPGLAEVELYRLHRRLLAAHCLGDAALIAELSMPDMVVASRGELLETTAADMQERFGALFERLDYTNYVDLLDPVIRVSGAGDIAWIAVNVRAIGRDRVTEATFDDRWAWVMMARNDDGTWRHAGNASNRAP